ARAAADHHRRCVGGHVRCVGLRCGGRHAPARHDRRRDAVHDVGELGSRTLARVGRHRVLVSAGYGDQPDASPATLFPVPLPSGAYFASGEIAYNTSLEVIYLGGYVQKNANCTDGIDAVPAGGTSGTPYLGNGYSTVCGPQFLRIDSTNSDVWFSEGTTPRYLADLSLSAGKVTDHHLPAAAAAAIPGDLAAGANGDIYFSLCNVTDSHPGGGNFMVRVNAGSTQQTLFSTYSTCANTVDSMLYDPNDGRVWLANDTNTLTAVRTTDGSVSTYTLTNGSSASS